MKRNLSKRMLMLLSLLCAPVFANAQSNQPGQSFNAWLNERIQSVIGAKLDLREKTRQTETPSISQNTTSLVDQSSASALIGIGLNLAGLSATSNDMEEANSVSVTATAYSLYAAAKGVNPLNPAFYNRNAAWRNLSITLGYDDEMNAGGGTTGRTKIIGFKYLIVNKREPGKHPEQLRTIRENLAAAAGAFGRLGDRAKAYIFKQPNVSDILVEPGFRAFLQLKREQATKAVDKGRMDKLLSRDVEELFVLGPDNRPPERPMRGSLTDEEFEAQRLAKGAWTDEEYEYYGVTFENDYFLSPGFQRLLKVLGEEEVDKIEQIVEQEIDPFVTLQKVSSAAIEKIRKAPQFSLSFLSKQRGEGPDDYMGEAIFDYGIVNRVNLTANGAFEYRDSKAIGADTRGARFAAQLEFQLTPEDRLVGRRPFNFYLATEGKWTPRTDWIYKGQTKINIPIADGIDFPISLTFANRTELIDEKEVRGQFGFTLDLARLIKAFAPK